MLEAEHTLESTRMGLLVNGAPPYQKLTKRPLENGNGNPSTNVTMKYKRRKVSAVRDFPPGCGRHAVQTNGRPCEVVAPAASVEDPKAGVDSAVIVEAGSVKSLGVPAVAESYLMSESPVPTEFSEQLVSSDQVEAPEPKITVPSVEMESPKVLDQEKLLNLTETVEPVAMEAKASDQIESLVDSKSSVPEMPLKSQSPTEPSIPASDNMEVRMAKKYPPRRRISAIRDFPPGCGRNDLPASREECLKAVASTKIRSFVDGTPVVESRPSANAKQLSEEVQEGDAQNRKLGVRVPKENRNTVRVKSEDVMRKEMNKGVQVGTTCKSELEREETKVQVVTSSKNKLKLKGSPVATSSEIKSKREDQKLTVGIPSESKWKCEYTKEISSRPPNECYFSQSDSKLQTMVKEVGKVVGTTERKIGREFKKQNQDKSVMRKIPETESTNMILEHGGERLIVQALMAAPNCPWSQGKRALKSNASTTMIQNKGKRHEHMIQDKSKSFKKGRNGAENLEGTSTKKVSPLAGKDDYQPADGDEENFLEDDEGSIVPVGQVSKEFNLSVTPYGLRASNNKDSVAVGTRKKVREILCLFQGIFRKLLHEEEAKSKEQGNALRRVDLQAAKLLKEKHMWVNTGKQILGPVPGVEVGDEFHYRVELAIIGLHHPFQGGIDYLKKDGIILATSIVASGGYADDMDSSDVLTYSGQGGNPIGGDKQAEDQKLERGNLAMKNSIDAQTPVRVIRGFKETVISDSLDAKGKIVATYTYDGLYLVENYWQEMGRHSKLVFKFQLRRIPGQPELALKEVKKSKKSKVREGLCVDDISNGKEKNPIYAVNTIDDEKPPPFNYITNMIYPEWYESVPPEGCDCIDGCLDSEKCSCAVKNGGEIPFNYNGAIVQAKPLVYECGPSCRCSLSCINRVSQHGIRFQLEVFKTNLRGWGVRSLTSIPSGSFICEYTGELLQEKEAEKRTGKDEYLFDIGHSYNDHSISAGLSTLIPDLQSSSSCEVVEDGFTIDAAKHGNVGRFVNHSCSPNLYAQNVLYDHEDKRMPHIMLFAAENIPPLQELTYHYNYKVDQVRDADGNIKKKSCYCGSSECTGRMY